MALRAPYPRASDWVGFFADDPQSLALPALAEIFFVRAQPWRTYSGTYNAVRGVSLCGLRLRRLGTAHPRACQAALTNA